MSKEKKARRLVCLALVLCLGTALPAANASAVYGEENTPAAVSAESEEAGYPITIRPEDRGLIALSEEDFAQELPVDPSTGYADVPADRYYYEPVKWALENGLIDSGETHLFRPREYVTRAEVMSLLWRAAGSPEPDLTQNPFFDVAPWDEALRPILWAWQSGIATGAAEGEFAPDRPCTRAEFITFLWRADGCWPMTGDSLDFRDVSWDKYYCSAVAWSVEYGVAAGTSKTDFTPKKLCTNADAVTFLYRCGMHRAYPDYLLRDESGWRCLIGSDWAADNWLIRDGHYYHFNAAGYLDKVSTTAPSLVSIPGYYIHPMKASVYSTREERIEAMISTAYEYLGDPFVVYRSTAPHSDGVDCSGLVMQCLYAAGFDPYPATPEHHSYTEYDSRTLWNEVEMPHIDPAEMQRGDLVFYKKNESSKLINHIAIYLGNGYVIEAWPNKVTDRYAAAGYPHSVIYGVARPIC